MADFTIVSLGPYLAEPEDMKAPIALISVVLAFSAAAEGEAHANGGNLGLGIMLGAPSGLSGKYYTGTRGFALVFGAGVFHDYEFGHHDDTQIHLDALWHPTLLTSNNAFDMPFYLGLGGFFRDHDHYHGNDYYGDSSLGLRAPFGLVLDFRRAPVDVFVELVPTITFTDHYHDRLDISGAIGVRYYF